MRRWVNMKLIGLARWMVLRVSRDQIHTGTVRQMAREAAADLLTIRQIITPR